MRTEENVKMLDELKSLGVWPQDENNVDLPLAGKSYIVTGTLTSMGREEAEDKLRSLGAVVTSSVTKNTTNIFPETQKIQRKTGSAQQKMHRAYFISLSNTHNDSKIFRRYVLIPSHPFG